MAHLGPLERADRPDLEAVFAATEAFMGFVPRSTLTMARVPGLAEGFAGLGRAVMATPLLDPVTIQLVAHVASVSAGCRYCQAHTAEQAERRGADAALVEAVWDFERDERFAGARRAALRLARDAAQVPNAVTADHVAELREHYDDDQITALVAVVSFFGFLNRWNDTLATELEDEPSAFGEAHLAASGWEPGKHAG